MKKLEVTSAAFFYIVKELQAEVAGGYINNIQLVNHEDNNLIKIKIHKTKTKELIVSPQILFLTELAYLVNPESGGLIKFLKKKLYNQKIQEIKQNKNNRVVYFKLDDYYLIFEFFSNSNIILTDLEFKIITSKQKEEWKDRIIKKNEKYFFPKGKDLSEKTQKELLEEIKDKDLKATISYFVKEYNIYSGYINKEKTQKDIIKKIKELYDYKNPIFALENGNTENELLVLVAEGKEKQNAFEFFKIISETIAEKLKTEETKTEIKSKNKNVSIFDSQIKTRKEYEKIASELQLEGEKIYEYFQIIEKVNEQIRLAREKKVAPEEIIKKLNDYFSKNQKELSIKSIDTKERSYVLEIKD
jgi:predicted ribosome quality control (RQC) complex YloA/Tae2 family protein